MLDTADNTDPAPAAARDAAASSGQAHAMSALPNPDYESLSGYAELVGQITNQTRRDALELFLPEFQQRYLKYLALPPRNFEDGGPGSSPLLRAIQKDGCGLGRIETGRKAAIVAMTRGYAQALEDKIDQMPKPGIKDAQLVLRPDEHAAIFQAVDDAFENAGLYEAAAAYTGWPIRLKAMTVQVNNARETRLKYGAIGADGLPAHRGRYFHIDSTNWPPLKVLVYLTPVSLSQGPLRYVAGTHRTVDDFEVVVRKTNDRLRLSNLHFLALPPPFRMNTHFGDHVSPDEEGMAALIANELVLCDGQSDLAVFDNTGVHRGGFVRDGSRHILQCSMWADR